MVRAARARSPAPSPPAARRRRGGRGRRRRSSARRPCPAAGSWPRPPRRSPAAIEAAASPTDEVPPRISSRPRRGRPACPARPARSGTSPAARPVTSHGKRGGDRHQQRVGQQRVLGVAAVERPAHLPHHRGDRRALGQPRVGRGRPRRPRTRSPAPAGTARPASAPAGSAVPTGSGRRPAPAPGSSPPGPPAPAAPGSPAPPGRRPGRRPPLASSSFMPSTVASERPVACHR